MRHSRGTLALLLLLAAAACEDRPTPTAAPLPDSLAPVPPAPPAVVGLYQIEVTGIGSSQASSSIAPARTDSASADGARLALTSAGAGLVFEQVSSSSFTEGARGQGGQRYVNFTYRVRNGTGVPLDNLTVLLVSRTGTVAGTALSSLRRFDGTAASSAIASQVVPTGAVALASDLSTMQALYPDVLQVLSEAEVAAIAKPADVTEIFPVGYVVRNRRSTTTRLLPPTADANQFDGVLTLSFRLPLQATAAADVFSFFFQILAVTDTERRLTETVEEGQDTAAVRRLRERATSLGATSVTVLNGSPAAAPSVPDYPGQRQLCSVRTAGTAASPVTFITHPAGYSKIMLLLPGESLNGCSPYFRTGSAARPATNVPFTVTATAVDRYGNLRTSAADTVRLVQESGPPATMGPAAVLASGQAPLAVTYADYGTSLLRAVGRRVEGVAPIQVAGVTRTWTAGAGTTDWHTNGNWSPAAVPMSLDSVVVPVAAPLDPVLAANVSVAGVTVEDVATVSLGAFDLTATGNVATGATGGINNTVGHVILAGSARTVRGRLPRVRVTGTYSLSGNLTTRAALEVWAGDLTSEAFSVESESN